MRKSIALLLTITFVVASLLQPVFGAADSGTALSTGMSNFRHIKTYTGNTFKDVLKSQWYYSDVVDAYSYGIMSGIGNNRFNPSGNMTIAEAIAIAARISSIYNGGDGMMPPSNPEIWYSGNLSYAECNGILKKGEFAGQYNKPATRAQLVHIYSKAIVPGELPAKNNIISIPDISATTPYYNDIITMYKAGVVVGTDAQGNFRPNARITRAEAAVILNRIINPDKRQTFTPALPNAQNAFEQLMATGKYVKGTGRIYSQGDCLFYKDAYPDLSDNRIRDNLKWYIFIDPAGGPTYDTKNYECEIILTKWKFDLVSRRQVRDALKILYPTGYIQVYDYMMKALNFDLWEAGRMNTLNATSGTMWTHYADGRAINVQFQYDIGAVRIYLYKVGYTQAPPEQANSIIVKTETETAKNFAGWLNTYKTCQLGTY